MGYQTNKLKTYNPIVNGLSVRGQITHFLSGKLLRIIIFTFYP